MGKGSLSSKVPVGWLGVGRYLGRHGTTDRLPFLSLASSDPMDKEGDSYGQLLALQGSPIQRCARASPRTCRPCDRTARAHLTQAAVRLHTARTCTLAAVLEKRSDLASYRSHFDIDYRHLQMRLSSDPPSSTRSAE